MQMDCLAHRLSKPAEAIDRTSIQISSYQKLLIIHKKSILFVTYILWTYSPKPVIFALQKGKIIDNPQKSFGKKLRELRKTKGWSQEYLALESGLDRSYVSEVERGLRNISVVNIHRLAEALSVSPKLFFD